MEPSKTISFKSVFITTLILGIIGWGGLVLVVFFMQPYLGPRWLFFFLLMIAISATVLPITAFLNRRFPSEPPAEGAVIVRQAMWVGGYAALCAWLMMGRVLSAPLAGLLGVGFLAVELLIRMYEKSRWKPKDSSDE